MALTRSEVIQIDATVIIGLLVLMAFQTTVPPTYSQQYSEVLSEYRGIHQEHGRLVDLLLQYCNLSDEYEISKDYHIYPVNFLGVSIFSVDDPYFDTIDLDNLENSQCEQWKLEFHQVLVERDGIKEWVTALGIPGLVDFSDAFDQLTMFTIGGGLMVNVINLFLIIPFSTSAVVEAIRSSTGQRTDDASRAGKGLMTVGFVSLIVGFVLIIGILICGVFPLQFCLDLVHTFL